MELYFEEGENLKKPKHFVNYTHCCDQKGIIKVRKGPQHDEGNRSEE